MEIKPKHFYYNETENRLIFVSKVEKRHDGVEIVWASKVNKKDSIYTHYASGFLFNHKLVGFLAQDSYE
jgi:hypothetical protein